jgi:hypothetical protein
MHTQYLSHFKSERTNRIKKIRTQKVWLGAKGEPKGQREGSGPKWQRERRAKGAKEREHPEPKGKERALDLKEPGKSYSTQSAFFQCSYHHAISSYHQHIQTLSD